MRGYDSATEQQADIVGVQTDEPSARIARILERAVGVAKDLAAAIPRDSIAICESACDATHDLVATVAYEFSFQHSYFLTRNIPGR